MVWVEEKHVERMARWVNRETVNKLYERNGGGLVRERERERGKKT